MSDKDHMVCVNNTEGDESITHDCEESDEDIVDYINDIVLPTADIDPTDEEKYPCKTEECN